MTKCRIIRWFTIAAFVAGAAQAAPALAGESVLRICADPDNLPFSKADGPEHGFYRDLSEKVAARLGSSTRYVWWLTFNERKALRNTILADECDVTFVLPADKEYHVRGVERTQPFMDVSYAIVTPASVSFSRLDDLKGKRIAVQFGTVAAIVLATHEGYQAVTFRGADEAMAALAKGEADAAFIWGPVAGYENLRNYGGRFKITPVAGEGLNGQVSVAVRKGKGTLLHDIDQALTGLKPDIAKLADKYGFPRAKPLALQLSRADGLTVPAVAFVKTGDYSSSGATVATAQTTTPAGKGDAAAGRIKFNDSCSHCHSVDGASPLSERDLRRLRLRYDAKWPEVALKTINEGRPDLGMPTWKDALKPDEVANILAFFGTIQK